MKSELAEEIFGLIEARLDPRPTPMEFERAYKGRIAIARIRFAIQHSEQFGPHTDEMRDAGLQRWTLFTDWKPSTGSRLEAE
jgi:hypothetical protein